MADDTRRVLIIAYYFPPLGLSGVQRTVKFAKYLGRYGWTPTVLTVEPGGYYAFDESLLREVEEVGVRIVRAASVDLNRLFKKKGVVRMPGEFTRKVAGAVGDFFFIPDTKIGWKKRALAAGIALCAETRFDAILATAPPQTDFLVGMELKRRTGIPLLLDYRDAWLEYPFKTWPTPIHLWLHRRLEREVIHASNGIVTTHRRIKESLLRRNRALNYHDVAIVSQGYDSEDFEGAVRRAGAAGRMRIVHAGTFYGRRSPEVLLRAVHNVLAAQPDFRSRFDIRFVGAQRKQDLRLVKKLGLESVVTFEGYLEHRACVHLMRSTDVLWYVIDNDMQSPGKLYEYFATGRPILASMVEGYTRQEIVESGGGMCVPLLDVPSHERALLELLARFDQGTLPSVPSSFSDRFDRFRLTGSMARQLESLLNHDRAEIRRVDEDRS
ncbi:MAG: glycosyltransferase family 4 protein [Bacteroidetes bacterium]|jgi:glycosyltransferase involved in cell wall biosynthesis|nr:glycosyltransferase family 4 protein [Bacteroidota bacterium]